MSEAKLSERAQKILSWLTSPQPSPQTPLHPVERGDERERVIRQQTLADQFGCSRRSIGRALQELKSAGLLVDLNRRHENRCKMYQLTPPLHRVERGLGGEGLTPQAQTQWERYEKTFRIVFTMPELENLYAQVTWDLAGVREESELWSKTFAGLWAMTGN